jgi:hypothetical protein
MKLLEIKITRKKWAKGDKKRKRNVLLHKTIVIVLEWWTYETRVSPNKKKVITNLIARNAKEMYAKHYMQENEVIFLNSFLFIKLIYIRVTSSLELEHWFDLGLFEHS